MRFAVGSCDGARSSTWRVWTAKNSNDVYVAARPTAGVMKASLHQTGSWQQGFIDGPKAEKWLAGLDSRHLDLWQKPAEIGPGFTRGYAIAVPYSELRAWPAGAAESGDVIFLPPPGDQQVVQIEIFLIRSTDPPAALHVEQGLAVAQLAMQEGNRAAVVARLLPWAAESIAAFQELKCTALATADPQRLAEAGMPRLALYGQDVDGTRMVIDAAAD